MKISPLKLCLAYASWTGFLAPAQWHQAHGLECFDGCQDNPAYISHLGGGCEHLSRFDCTALSFIGYTEEEVNEVINACPCSCNVPCGTWTVTPSAAPSSSPTVDASASPTALPSASPSAGPTAAPSESPSASPSAGPTTSLMPVTFSPSQSPTLTLSDVPLAYPTSSVAPSVDAAKISVSTARSESTNNNGSTIGGVIGAFAGITILVSLVACARRRGEPYDTLEEDDTTGIDKPPPGSQIAIGSDDDDEIEAKWDDDVDISIVESQDSQDSEGAMLDASLTESATDTTTNESSNDIIVAKGETSGTSNEDGIITAASNTNSSIMEIIMNDPKLKAMFEGLSLMESLKDSFASNYLSPFSEGSQSMIENNPKAMPCLSVSAQNECIQQLYRSPAFFVGSSHRFLFDACSLQECLSLPQQAKEVWLETVMRAIHSKHGDLKCIGQIGQIERAATMPELTQPELKSESDSDDDGMEIEESLVTDADVSIFEEGTEEGMEIEESLVTDADDSIFEEGIEVKCEEELAIEETSEETEDNVLDNEGTETKHEDACEEASEEPEYASMSAGTSSAIMAAKNKLRQRRREKEQARARAAAQINESIEVEVEEALAIQEAREAIRSFKLSEC